MTLEGDSAEDRSLEDMSHEGICELSPNELVRISPNYPLAPWSLAVSVKRSVVQRTSPSSSRSLPC